MHTKKHHAEVIEVYPEEGRAAIRFSWRGRERVETCSLYLGPDCVCLEVGMKGWATYTMTPSCGLWGFSLYAGGQPSKN